MKVYDIVSGLDSLANLLRKLTDINLGNTVNLVNDPDIQQLVRSDSSGAVSE